MAMDTVHRPIPGFVPSTPSVTSSTIDAVLESHSLVAVHFWAVWNGSDPPMDAAITRSSSEAHFASCNVDDPKCVDLCKRCGIANVPTVAVFVDGQLRPLIIGLLDSDALDTAITDRVATPATERKWWRFW